jgi:hypothetical protein
MWEKGTMVEMIPKEVLVAAVPTPWEKVLHAWFQVSAQYIRAVTPYEVDTPWWYNERASIGFLAAAIWRAGGVALEEFATDKATSPGRRGKGRGDLYAVIDGCELYAEAKQVWYDPPTRQPCGFADAVRAALAVAHSAARRHKSSHGRRYAVVCAAPRLAAPHAVAVDPRQVDAQIAKWWMSFQQITCTAKAWYFPAVHRTTPIDDGLLYPGATIFIEDADHST